MIKRVKACLVGGMLGDAFGSKFELSDIPAGDDRWNFTDDTQLTVATCESLMRSGKINLGELAQTFKTWYMRGQIHGIGAPTLMAMVQLQSGANWQQAGAKGDHAATNDAAMRIAPLAFLLDPHDPVQRETMREACRITHHHEEAFHAALAVSLAIRHIDEDHTNIIPIILKHLPPSEVRNRLENIAAQSYTRIKDVARANGNGAWAVESIPFAIYAASQAKEMGIQAMLKAVASSGGDTDTNCHLAAQIAAAGIGLESVPSEWMDRLHRTAGFDDYYAVVKEFAEYVNRQQGIPTLF